MTAYAPVAPFLQLETWITIADGNDEARELFNRHYSRRRYLDGREPKIFVGPGEKLVLTTPCRRALFVWRNFISLDDQEGINCSVFRNEGAALASDLVRAADIIADRRWPGQRHYTYVDAKKTAARRGRLSLPGKCFLAAGWRYVLDADGNPRRTKRSKLYILERPAP